FVKRKVSHFNFVHVFSKLPKVLSWDEFSRIKGNLAFIAQNFESRSIVTILVYNLKSTIIFYLFMFTREFRVTVEFVTF
ncbi:ISL3 family transposase, partial [Streptococcus suis]